MCILYGSILKLNIYFTSNYTYRDPVWRIVLLRTVTFYNILFILLPMKENRTTSFYLITCFLFLRQIILIILFVLLNHYLFSYCLHYRYLLYVMIYNLLYIIIIIYFPTKKYQTVCFYLFLYWLLKTFFFFFINKIDHLCL